MAKKKVRRKQEIPETESASERFIRIVTPRVNKAVKAVEVIGFCTGSTYEYTSKQAEQIAVVLHKAVKDLMRKFAGEVNGGGSFTLDK